MIIKVTEELIINTEDIRYVYFLDNLINIYYRNNDFFKFNCSKIEFDKFCEKWIEKTTWR